MAVSQNGGMAPSKQYGKCEPAAASWGCKCDRVWSEKRRSENKTIKRIPRGCACVGTIADTKRGVVDVLIANQINVLARVVVVPVAARPSTMGSWPATR